MKESFNLNLDELFSKKSTTVSQSSGSVTLKIDNKLTRNGYSVYKLVIITKGETSPGEIYLSPEKPYILMDVVAEEGSYGSLTFNGLEKKEFSLDDYAGYKIVQN